MHAHFLGFVLEIILMAVNMLSSSELRSSNTVRASSSPGMGCRPRVGVQMTLPNGDVILRS